MTSRGAALVTGGARRIGRVLAATAEEGVQYVTRTDATRWIARKCPDGESARSWITLDTACDTYFFTMRELRSFIDAGDLKTKIGVTGSAKGVEYILRHQCGQLLEKIGFTEEQAARRAALRPGARPPKIVGGSTITQQLAKNLLLSGERTLLRKGQEFVLTMALELLLSKQRILEIYLNHVEWGEGVFGAEAAAQHYYRKPASKLSAYEAARLAVMLPRPKYFEKVPNSGYLSSRAGTIVARMGDAVLP